MIRLILDLYTVILVVYVVISYFPQYRYKDWYQLIQKLGDFTCKPIRNALPRDLPFDPSPIIVFFIISLIKTLW